MCSPRLRHRPVRGRHHQDAPVHLRRARNHVLDVVRVPRAVHVRVVPVRRRVLHVRRRNRDPPLPLFRRVVDRVERPGRIRRVVLRHDRRDRRRQRRLPVINMSNRPDVDVRFRPIKFFFRHRSHLGASPRTPARPSPPCPAPREARGARLVHSSTRRDPTPGAVPAGRAMRGLTHPLLRRYRPWIRATTSSLTA